MMEAATGIAKAWRMRSFWRGFAYGTVMILVPYGDSAIAQSTAPVTLAQTIPLRDVRGRIDHLDIDPDSGRLFVAALGNDTAEVVDLRTGERAQRLEHLQEPQGVAFAAKTGTLYVTNGRGARVDVFSGNPLAAVAHIDGLEDADNVRYDAPNGKLYVGYGNALAVIDTTTAKIIARIKLAGHPESFQLEKNGSRVFVNIPQAQHIAVIDRRTNEQIATWKLGDVNANFPMALDGPGHRLFVATRRPSALLVYDIATGKRVTTLPIAGDADDVFYDAARKRIYVICGEGVVDVVQQNDTDQYRTVANIQTSPGARTGLFVAARNALYVAVPARAAAPAEIRVYAVQ
jgi:DNA-binding beta-propeller fold protein YncE